MDIVRKLASIRRIRGLVPIEGADFIELAKIDGWQCVVKKGEFSVGEMGVFFEIDSFLPAGDCRYSFLSKNVIQWNGKSGIRIRTMKLRGCLSQGLMLPVGMFPELSDCQEGDDVTGVLGIEKWERMIPAQLAGQIAGSFPAFIPKTDQERIQNLVDRLDSDIRGRLFECSIKLDGSSMTVFWDGNGGGVCSRNFQLKETEGNAFWRVARQQRILDALEGYGKRLALQGELIGEGIQGNHEKISGLDFYVFDVFDIDAGCFMGWDEREKTIAALNQCGATLKMVPVVDRRVIPNDFTVDDFLNLAEGPSLFAPTREGIVFKRDDGLFSFKAISNGFLMKFQDR